MNIDDLAIKKVQTPKEAVWFLPAPGLPPMLSPKFKKTVLVENSNTGGPPKTLFRELVTTNSSASKTEDSHWYALRTTYGREKKAYDYIKVKVELLSIVRLVDGKRKTVEESRLPNIFFAYGTEEEIKSFVYDNVNLPYLRFYYRYFHISKKVEKEPLIVSNNQIESLRIICKADADDIIVSIDEVQKFQKGQAVRILKGNSRGG